MKDESAKHDRWELVGRRMSHVHVNPRTSSSSVRWADGTVVDGITQRITYVVDGDNCTRQLDDGSASWTLPKEWVGRTVFEFEENSPFLDQLHGVPSGIRFLYQKEYDENGSQADLRNFLSQARDLHAQ